MTFDPQSARTQHHEPITPGRIVHLRWAFDGVAATEQLCIASIVTARGAKEETVFLTPFLPPGRALGVATDHEFGHGAIDVTGTWHWPRECGS